MIPFAVGAVLGAVVVGVMMIRRRRRADDALRDILVRVADRDPGRKRDGPLVEQLRREVYRMDRQVADLRIANERNEAAFDALPVPTIVVDEAGTVVGRNAAAVAEDGRSHTGPLVATAVDEVVSETLLTGLRCEQLLRLTGPPRRTLRIEAHPIAVAGEQPEGAVAFVIDDSALERVDEMRRDFVANLSHELKTPVGAIALLSETLRDETEPEVRNRLLHKTEAEAHRLASIIDDLLELAELEANPDPLDDPVAIADAVAEAVDQVRGSTHGAGRVLLVRADDPVKVSGDHRLIVSALVNLIENACKYSGIDTAVTVATSVVGPGTVDVTVADEGIGIPQKQLDRIFERFYRVDRGRSRATGGTGLGLSIVRHTMEQMGGQVLVESREGHGSEFTLRFVAMEDDR